MKLSKKWMSPEYQPQLFREIQGAEVEEACEWKFPAITEWSALGVKDEHVRGKDTSKSFYFKETQTGISWRWKQEIKSIKSDPNLKMRITVYKGTENVCLVR